MVNCRTDPFHVSEYCRNCNILDSETFMQPCPVRRPQHSRSGWGWAVELKNREEAFAFLTQAVKADQLNHNQFLNALHMLYRMALPEYTTEVLRTFVDLSAHPDLAIRSEAVQLAIGLVRLSTSLKTPLLFSNAQEKSLREAMGRGLTTKIAVVEILSPIQIWITYFIYTIMFLAMAAFPGVNRPVKFLVGSWIEYHAILSLSF